MMVIYTEVHLLCLHTTSLLRINKVLDAFVESWNNHPLLTERNRTINQLFVEGALTQNMTPFIPLVTPGAHPSLAPTPVAPVRVPRSSFEPCSSLARELDHCDFICITDDFGYALYRTFRHLQPCNNCIL